MTDFLDRYGEQLRTAKLPPRRRAMRRGFLASFAVLAVAAPTVALTAPDRTPPERERTFSVLERPQTEADRRAVAVQIKRMVHGQRDPDRAGARAVGEGYVVIPVTSMESTPGNRTGPYLCLAGGGGASCVPHDRVATHGLISFSGDHRGSRTVGVVPDGVAHVRFVPKAGTPTQVEVTGDFFNLYAPSEPTARRIEPPTGWAGPRGRAGLIERPPVQPIGHLEWLDAQGAVIGPKQP